MADEKNKARVDVYTLVTLWARRLGRHYVVILLAALTLTAVSVLVTTRLTFNSDLADLLPEDHPDLRILRRIQARYSTDTGFMVLLSRNYVFAVDERGAVHMHDGSRWIRTPVGTGLNAVWGFGADDVYAAGRGGHSFHFDGKRWESLPPATRATIQGLWGPEAGRLLAVGEEGTILSLRDGRWRTVPSPTTRWLRAVSGAAGEVYAVGDGGTILRATTGRGGPVFRVEASHADVDLLGVHAFGGGRAVAVGRRGAFLVRGPDGIWRPVASGASGNLNAVWGSRPGNVQAVGDGGVVLHYDGRRIKRQITATKVDLHAVHGVKHDDVWVAGDRCTVKRYDWEWYPGPFDSQGGGDDASTRTCVARLTGIWRPPASLDGAKALAPRLAAALEKSPNVSRVEYKKPVKFFWDRALLFSSIEDLQKLRDRIEENLERETAKGTGLYVDLEENRSRERKKDLGQLFKRYQRMAASFGSSEWFVHPDGASLGLVVYPKKGVSDFENLRRLWREIEATIARFDPAKVDPLLRVDVSGDAVAKLREYDATVHDVFGNVWIAVVGIILLMLVYFRRIIGLFFVALPLGMSIAWTFAITTIFIGTLNAVTGFLFAVLFGLGIDYGLQLFARYREGRSAGLSVDDAMNHVILDTGRATLTSALTTSAALLTLTVTQFKGFSEFGFIAGIGVLLALISFILVMPAMILLAERLKLLKIKVSRTTAAGDREAPGQEPFRGPWAVLIVSALLLAYGAFGATRVRFEYDNRKLRPVQPKDEILRRAGRTMGRSFTPTLLVADSRDGLEAAVSAIERTSRRLGKRSAVKNVITILDMVPERQREKKALLEEIDELLRDKRWNLVSEGAKRRIKLSRLRELARARPFTLGELPAAARRSFKGPGFGDIWLALVFHSIDLGHTKQARVLKEQVGRFDGAPWVNLRNLLPQGATASVELTRGEITCPGQSMQAKRPCVERTLTRLRRLTHDGKPVFEHVTSRRDAYRQKLAVAGGLRGDVLAVASPGFILRDVRGPSDVQPSGVFHVSSGELVLSEVVEVLLHDGRIAFALALAAIFLAALLDFRSLRSALLACLPLVVGLLWTFGVMSLIHLRLNLFNFVILPALLGIGIDYGVHYVHRYHTEGQGHLGQVMRALYWVIFFCAATTIVGFGNMALATHPGLKSLGHLAIIGLTCMFFASTYTLPAVLFALERIRGVQAPEVARAEAPTVTVYATTYCPSCRLVRRLLADNGVSFAYVEVDALPAKERQRLAKAIVAATGADALPVTRVGDTYVVGFRRAELIDAVARLDAPTAATAPRQPSGS